jgi:hypothetical protein
MTALLTAYGFALLAWQLAAFVIEWWLADEAERLEAIEYAMGMWQ